MANRLTLLCGCVLLLGSAPARPAVSDNEIQALREQIRLLSERLDQLERQAPPAGAAATAIATAAPAAREDADLERRIASAVDAQVEERMAAVAWAERINWSGDFRYRFENIAEDGKEDRNRNRIRARASLNATLSDTMRAGLGLASGSDDPVSTNQTLGDGSSRKQLNIDMAYFEWSAPGDIAVTGGKYRNPLMQVGANPLLWDSDWRPEGFALRYQRGSVFASAVGTWLESDSADFGNEFSYAAQLGIDFALGSRARLKAGAGFADIDAAGKDEFFGDGDFFGNSFDPATGTYLYDYRLVEGFAELALQGLGRPVILFADYVRNLDPDENDTGYSFGVQFGEAKAGGTWEFSYMYKKLEADAVLGLLTDSDFGGGGTDSKGSVLQGAYAFHDSWFFEITYMINETGLQSGDPSDYDRLQVDLNFKYR